LVRVVVTSSRVMTSFLAVRSADLGLSSARVTSSDFSPRLLTSAVSLPEPPSSSALRSLRVRSRP
jgi:hypothetical protein